MLGFTTTKIWINLLDINKPPDKPNIQGYPQMIRLQRRLYGICLVRFLAFRVPCRPNCLISVINYLVNHHIIKNQALKGVFAKNERGYRLTAKNKRF